MITKVLNKKNALILLVLMYLFGSFGFCYFPNFFRPFTPFTILFTCFVFIIYQADSKLNFRFLISFLLIALIGFMFEVIGVKTGYIFGPYSYGNALGIKLYDVPIVISFNWALMACAAIIFAKKISTNKVVYSFIAASLATGVDLIIEQVAPILDYWYFKNGLAGMHNYFGWFVISFLMSFIFGNYFETKKFNNAFLIFSLLIFFFSVIYLFH